MKQNYGEMRQNTMGNRLNGKVSTPLVIVIVIVIVIVRET